MENSLLILGVFIALLHHLLDVGFVVITRRHFSRLVSQANIVCTAFSL